MCLRSVTLKVLCVGVSVGIKKKKKSKEVRGRSLRENNKHPWCSCVLCVYVCIA